MFSHIGASSIRHIRCCFDLNLVYDETRAKFEIINLVGVVAC